VPGYAYARYTCGSPRRCERVELSGCKAMRDLRLAGALTRATRPTAVVQVHETIAARTGTKSSSWTCRPCVPGWPWTALLDPTGNARGKCSGSPLFTGIEVSEPQTGSGTA